MQQHTTITIAFAAIVVWRLVVRVRRLVGRQESRLARHRAAVLVFPFLVGLLFVGALGETASMLALAGGTASGGVLALVGFRHTRLEVTAEGGHYFTPCGPIGIALAVLLVGRIAYHAVRMFESGGLARAGGDAVALTPATLFVFATLASYYGAYSLELLLWRSRGR